MISLIPQHEFDVRPEPYAEAVSRLASVRHALRLAGEVKHCSGLTGAGLTNS